MSALEDTIITVIVLLAPVGLVYGWYFYFARMSKEPLGWCGWLSVLIA